MNYIYEKSTLKSQKMSRVSDDMGSQSKDSTSQSSGWGGSIYSLLNSLIDTLFSVNHFQQCDQSNYVSKRVRVFLKA
jgi:hypothetical protein